MVPEPPALAAPAASDDLKILIVDEDSLRAQALIGDLGRIDDGAARVVIAANEHELRAALRTFEADAIVCRFAAGFGGLTALQIVRDARPATPLIFVSGSDDYGDSIAALRSGAEDYVHQSNIGRLPGAVLRAVSEARNRQRLELSLQWSEAQAREQATRLDALWRIVNSRMLPGDDLVDATLREAVAGMRPGQHFVATLGHIEGREFVLDAVSGDFGERGAAARDLLPLGLRVDVSETLDVHALETARTQSWDDCQALPDLPARTRASGVRSQIVTHFTASGVVHVLTLASIEPPTGIPFGSADYAYMELLGSFFARQLELEHMTGALAASEFAARRHGERLAALLEIANKPTLRGEELLLAMMAHVAAVIRPPMAFQGYLGRLEGDEAVMIAVGAQSNPGGSIERPAVAVGVRVPRRNTFIPPVGTTIGWADLQQISERPAELAATGWRACITTHFLAGDTGYSLTFASSDAATSPFGAEDRMYLDVLAATFAKQLEVEQLERSLRAAEELSRYHSERLETLWSIVNDSGERGEELLLAMLREVAGAIKPGQVFRATLWRLSSEDIIVETSTAPPDYAGKFPIAAGDVIPARRTLAGAIVAAGGGTQMWDDIQTCDDAGVLERQPETRAVIITTFNAGSTTWGITFASLDVARAPFDLQDQTYISVLAAFFANHVQQRWQFERIAYQQSHDVLTGLLNRSQFRSQARAIARTTAQYAIVLVGIDGFREVNSSYGNMIGDALLVEIGNALLRLATSEEIVGRIGGDVFAIFVPAPGNAESALRRAHAFAGAFAQPFTTGDRNGTDFLWRTACIGLATAPADGLLIDAILSHADAALVRAKQTGHGTIVAYADGMEGDAQRRARLRNELADAVEFDQFELYYQPHIELRSGNVTGCEALIRWNHPSRGLVAPGEFIPFAEECGIIKSIDNWVMRQAFASANELGASQPDFRTYFNLSGRQAGNPELIGAFVQAARNGVQLQTIGVEITESDAMRDVEATRHVCRALRRLGVRIAIDDFGTGYSSLSSLKRLPVDIVKIDRSFIAGVLADPHDQTIAETILSITERFGFDALAEGVEQSGEIAWLRERSCRYVQGFAICHPLPLAAFKGWLAGNSGEYAGDEEPESLSRNERPGGA